MLGEKTDKQTKKTYTKKNPKTQKANYNNDNKTNTKHHTKL